MGWNYLSIPKLQWCSHWNLGMDKPFHPTHYNGCNCLSMLGLKLNHVSKRGRRGYHGHNTIPRFTVCLILCVLGLVSFCFVVAILSAPKNWWGVASHAVCIVSPWRGIIVCFTVHWQSQRESTEDLHTFFIISLKMLLNKHSSNWWFEMPWCTWNVMSITSRTLWLPCIPR